MSLWFRMSPTKTCCLLGLIEEFVRLDDGIADGMLAMFRGDFDEAEPEVRNRLLEVVDGLPRNFLLFVDLQERGLLLLLPLKVLRVSRKTCHGVQPPV